MNLTRISGTLLAGILRSEKLVLLRGFDEIPRDTLSPNCRTSRATAS